MTYFCTKCGGTHNREKSYFWPIEHELMESRTVDACSGRSSRSLPNLRSRTIRCSVPDEPRLQSVLDPGRASLAFTEDSSAHPPTRWQFSMYHSRKPAGAAHSARAQVAHRSGDSGPTIHFAIHRHGTDL